MRPAPTAPQDVSLALYGRVGNDVEIAMALEEVGESLSQLGDAFPCEGVLRGSATELLREHGTDVEVGRVVIGVGLPGAVAGTTYDRAAELFDEGLWRGCGRSSSPREVAYALLNSGTARLALGDLEAAESRVSARAAPSTDRSWIRRDTRLLRRGARSAQAKTPRVAHDDAVALLGAADRQIPGERHRHAVIRALLVMTRRCAEHSEALGAAAFADAWCRGGDLSDDAIAASSRVQPAGMT